MFKKAQLKFTLFYSLIFLIFFWLFSLSLYFWLEHSLGETYIKKVYEVNREQFGQNSGEFNDKKTNIVTIAGDVALSQFKDILFIFNIFLIPLIPFISWFLAKRTLLPIQIAHEKQKRFVTNASHELRTPLSILNGEIEVALKKNRDISEYKKILLSGKEEVERLSQLVESLLFLARENKLENIALEQVDIIDCLAKIIAKLNLKIKEKNIIIDFKPSLESVSVKANERLMEQLFFNLIENSLKYTPEFGKIWINVRKIKNKIEISIKDNGIGISKINLKNIFNRFYRVDNSRFQASGYGLGLSIVKTIVEKYKGRISVFSDKKGTIFKVVINIG